MTLTPDQFKDFETLVYDIDGEIYEDYSGRGMFGKSCLGITVENLEKSLFKLGKESLNYDFYQELEWFRTDNMGRSYIIYFPKIQKAVDGE